MDRYSITLTPDRRRFGILDLHLFAFCTLPDGTGPAPNLLPLEWGSREAAETWLYRCYKLWETGQVPAPRDWRPRSFQRSPWE